MTLLYRTTLQLGLLAVSAMFSYGCVSDGDDPRTASDPSRSSALTAATPGPDCDESVREPGGTTATNGSTGRVEIGDFFIGGVFFADDTILRAKGHPECVAHLLSPDEGLAAAGTLTVGNDCVGTPGCVPASFAINPDYRNEYYEFPDPPLFEVGTATDVQV